MKTNANDAIDTFMIGADHAGNDLDLKIGLTKREYFAAMAMQGLIASCANSYPSRKETGKRAVEFADALIAALNAPAAAEASAKGDS